MKDFPNQIEVASNSQLVHRGFYRNKVWLPARKANEELSSRASWLVALEMTSDAQGRCVFPDGRDYQVPNINGIFDPENRWMTNFLAADECGTRPKTYSPYFERLRVIKLYCDMVELNGWS